ncbi:MAG: hypothetical protein C0507_15450 [Cyanobacteria bacterium PR.3.49]|nr:hypothetical protein [Cyanobacteria bacterium PR.3.49]
MPLVHTDNSVHHSQTNETQADVPWIDMSVRHEKSAGTPSESFAFGALTAASLRNSHEDMMLAGFSLSGAARAAEAEDAKAKPQLAGNEGEKAKDGADGGQKSAADGAQETDGESESTGADGTKVRTGPKGVVVEYPDGRTETTDPDGQVTTEYPKEVKNKDGTVTKDYPYDGRKETSGYDEDDPREKETEYPNGRKVTEYKDGHVVTKFEPNDPQKRESETVSKDGHVTTTRFRDGHTEQVDDRTGEIVKSYPPKNGKPGYNVTIGKDADGNTTVVTGPYQELKSEKE